MRYASKDNTCMRLVGFLDATTGGVHSWDAQHVTAEHLSRCLLALPNRYPGAQRIYLAWDNWPNHHSNLVCKALEAMPRVTVLPLPTYAPWLNPIEKVWRWLKQWVVHAHPWCDDFRELRDNVCGKLGTVADGSPELLKYTGLSI
jgi:hypothetical protein